MATRINTKFAIILAVAVLLGGVGSVWAVKTFIFKSAEQHAAIGEDALEEGLAALAAGNVEEANALLDRAARKYNAAHRKDPSNTEYLYQSIIANSAYVCDSTTEAQNRLSMIYGARQFAHDSIQATEEDKTRFYEELMARHRMGLVVENNLPWIPNIFTNAEAQVVVDENDILARRWRGIAGVYLLRNDMPPEERAVSLDDLNAALAQTPNDPVVLHHIAVWHINEARRIRTAQGGTTTDTTTQLEAQSQDFSAQALAAAPEDPYNALNHLDLLLNLPLSEEVRTAVTDKLLALGRQLSDNADARAQLYDSELLRVISWLVAHPQIMNDPEDSRGPDLAVAIANAMVDDAPDHMRKYHALGSALLGQRDYQGAIDALEAGLAIERPLGAQDYLLDLQADLSMLYLVAETYTTMAADVNPDVEQRDALLAKAEEALVRYAASEGGDSRQHESRIDYLRGRAAYVQGIPHLAIQHLEAANRFAQNTNLDVLMLLAKAHDRNGNTGKAIEYYERLLAPGMQPGAVNERFRLVRIYIGLGGEYLERANEHINLFLEYNPNNVQARLLKAEILAAAGRFDAAAQVVASIDLEANPQFTGTYANYLAQDGRAEEALALVRERLNTEPNDSTALSLLFSQVTDPEQQQVELDKLIALGLSDENSALVRRVIETEGQMTIEDWQAFETERGTPQLDINKALFRNYQRTGQDEKMREVLATLVEMAPDDKLVLTWQYELAIADKDWAQADRFITEILALDPSERPAIAASNGAFMRAKVQTGRMLDEAEGGQTPNLREVVRAYTDALEENDTFAPGWIALGQVYLLQNDIARARDAFDRAYRIQRTNVEAAILLARTLRQTGETDAALDLYREVLRRNPNNSRLMSEYIALEAQSGNRPTAIAQLEATRETRPQDSANRRMLALMYAQDDRIDDALAEIDAIVSYEGETRQSAVSRAEIYSINNQPEQSISQLQAYVEGRGDAVKELDYLSLAEYLLRGDEQEEAEAVIQQAVAIEDPATRQSSRFWAETLVRMSRMEEAAAVYQDLIRAFPEDASLKMQVAKVYISMAESDRALSILDSVPASAEKEFLRAQAERFRGNTETALAIVVNAQQTYSNAPVLLNMQAQLLTILGEADLSAGETERGQSRFEEALAIYSGLVERNASLYDIRVQIARIRNVLGKTDEAITDLEQVLDEKPDHTPARLALFGVYLQQARTLSTNDTRRAGLAGSALAVITPVIEAQPENASALRGGGEAAREAGQFRQSAVYFERAFAITGATQDLGQQVTALLDDRRPADVITLLENPDYATHLRDSLVLRAIQARALANTNQTDEARNLFRSVLGRAESVEELAEITQQLSISALRSETPEIVEDVLGDDLPTEIEYRLVQIERASKDWEALIERLSRYDGNPTGNAEFDRQSMMALALAYQELNDDPANLLQSKRIYERLLENPANADNMELLNNLAYLLSDQLEGEEYGRQAVVYARRAADNLKSDDPDLYRAQILDTLGWALFRAGEIDEARNVLRQSIETQSMGVNNMHLGLLFMSLGGENNDLQAERYLDDGRRASNDPAERAKIQQYLDEIDRR
ncbi:MAG: tetratricopeptide repeat protein [Planctomycetota bacterium]